MKRWLTALAIIFMMGCATAGRQQEDVLNGNVAAPVKTDYKSGIEGEIDKKEKVRALFDEGLKLINNAPRSALNFFSEVIRLSPMTWEAHYNAALCHIRLRDFKKAEAELIKSLNKKAPPAKIYNTIGAIYLYDNDKQKAIETFEMSLTTEKTTVAFVNLAGLYNSMGQMEKAIKYYNEAAVLDSANRALYTALISYSTGRYESAREYFKTAIDNGNRNTKIMYLYVQTLLKVEDYNTALNVLQEIYTAASSDPNPYRDMGIIYEVYLGDLNNALKNYSLYIDYSGEKAKEVVEWVNIINMRLTQEDGR